MLRWLKHRTIRRGELILMERYYVFPRGSRDEGKGCPFSIKLHHLQMSDPGDLHDHPWWFMTILLKGGYWETTPKGRKWKRPGSIIFHKAEDLHALTIPDGGSWSLFLNWRRKRLWGFQTPDGWVPWYEYEYPEEYSARLL